MDNGYGGTYRSTDGPRSHQVSWSDITAIDCVMSKLLFHSPVHVLVTEKKNVSSRTVFFLFYFFIFVHLLKMCWADKRGNIKNRN